MFIFSRYTPCQLTLPSTERTLVRGLCYAAFFEAAGLGCGFGPSAGKIRPPFSSCFHFGYMGTAKIPSLPSLGQRGTRRNVLDVACYAAFLSLTTTLMLGPAVDFERNLLNLILCWIVLGVSDQTFLLASRSEVYLSPLIVIYLSFARGSNQQDWMNGVRVVQFFIWFWAGLCKLGVWWNYVLPVMTSCNPFFRYTPGVRKLMYEDWPRSVEPSNIAKLLSTFSSVSQVVFPICLAIGGPVFGMVGLFVAVQFHVFIILNYAMGMPQEWNVYTIANAFFLFSKNLLRFDKDIASGSFFRAIRIWAEELPSNVFGPEHTASFPGITLTSLSFPVAAYLLIAHVIIPCIGQLYPNRVSFLLASRYNSGNWPTTFWLVKKSALWKVETKIMSFSYTTYTQLLTMYKREDLEDFDYFTLAGRAMHLNSRGLLKLLPKCVGYDDVNINKDDDEKIGRLLDEYNFLEGELLAGCVLGWCFGDGQLTGEALLREVQNRCEFNPDEIVHVEIGSFPLLESFGGADWKIRRVDGQEIKVVAKGSFLRNDLAGIKL